MWVRGGVACAPHTNIIDNDGTRWDGESKLMFVPSKIFIVTRRMMWLIVSWQEWMCSLHIKANNISTTVHAMTKSFVPFCSAQDGEFADINCLVFWAHWKNGEFWIKHQVYNKGIFTNFRYFLTIWNIECAVDSELNGAINFVVSCSVVEIIHSKKSKILCSVAKYLNKCTC